MQLGEQADQGEIRLPENLVIQDEVTLRRERLENLAQAKAVLEVRAQERYAVEKAEYDEKVREREAKARKHRKRPVGEPLNRRKPVHVTKINTILQTLSRVL